jgi:hypothetical protein
VQAAVATLIIAVVGIAAVVVPSVARSSDRAREAAGSPRQSPRQGTFAGEVGIGGGRKLYCDAPAVVARP